MNKKEPKAESGHPGSILRSARRGHQDSSRRVKSRPANAADRATRATRASSSSTKPTKTPKCNSILWNASRHAQIRRGIPLKFPQQIQILPPRLKSTSPFQNPHETLPDTSRTMIQSVLWRSEFMGPTMATPSKTATTCPTDGHLTNSILSFIIFV